MTTRKNNIKSFNKNKKENNNIFTNVTLWIKSLYTLRNYKKIIYISTKIKIRRNQ